MTVLNTYTSELITPELQRAQVLSGISSVFIILISYLWTETKQVQIKRSKFSQPEGFILNPKLDGKNREELAWASHLFLTTTPSISVCIYWDNEVLLKRGILGTEAFEPGMICKEVAIKKQTFYMPKASLYPGAIEFESIAKDLPSIIVVPLSNKGFLIVGGSSERCFNKFQEKMFSSWGERISYILDC